MQTKFKILRELLDYLDQYENVGEKTDQLDDFVIWLQNQRFDTRLKKPWDLNQDFSCPENVNTNDVAEADFSTSLATLFRFAKNYTKKAFEKTSFKTLDEFGFLASLFKHKSMHKSTLINQHMLEISSGSEIIRRLIHLGLIREIRDEHDKRAKIIMLTDKGNAEIIHAFSEMNKAAKIIAGNLTKNELQTTNYALSKLKSFHEYIHQNEKGGDLNEILEKYTSDRN